LTKPSTNCEGLFCFPARGDPILGIAISCANID
jgi:hypothetical protein